MYVLFDQPTYWVVVFLVSFAPFANTIMLGRISFLWAESMYSTWWHNYIFIYSFILQSGVFRSTRKYLHSMTALPGWLCQRQKRMILLSSTVFSVQSPQQLIGPFRWEHAPKQLLSRSLTIFILLPESKHLCLHWAVIFLSLDSFHLFLCR